VCRTPPVDMPQFGLFDTFVERFRAGFSEGKSLICWLPSRGQTLQLSLLLISRLKVRFLPRSPLTLANIYAVFFASGTDAKFVEFRRGQHSVSSFGESRSGRASNWHSLADTAQNGMLIRGLMKIKLDKI
jgi:hypothetical protein